jgi:hypothetical protein
MATEFSVSKTIRLTALVPDDYRLWAAQTEATFSVHGVWDLMLGQRVRPQPGDAPSSGNRPARASPAVDDATKWERQHALAHQALLACLPPSELTKVYQLCFCNGDLGPPCSRTRRYFNSPTSRRLPQLVPTPQGSQYLN